MRYAAKKRILRALRAFAVYVILAGLLWWALRDAPLSAIRDALGQLRLWQLGLLLAINCVVIGFMTMRWWLMVHAENPRVPFLPLIGYRLSAFALSYFTPGPQVGGEPLQVIYLRRYHGISVARAVSAVILDKLIEFIGNFLIIGVGLAAVAQAGILPGASASLSGILTGAGWVALAALMAWPAVHLILLYRGRQPLSAGLRAAFPRFDRSRWFRMAIVSEYLAGTFVRRHPGALAGALAASLVAWSGMGVEYLLILKFLHIDLLLWEALAALTASLLAFLIPVPGGLGALEASQVLALGAFGHSAAQAISLTLLMRARDLLNAGVGAVLAGGRLAK